MENAWPYTAGAMGLYDHLFNAPPAGHLKAGVAGGPVTDWKYYEVMYGERYMDRPEENVDGYAANRLHNHVENLKATSCLSMEQ